QPEGPACGLMRAAGTRAETLVDREVDQEQLENRPGKKGSEEAERNGGTETSLSGKNADAPAAAAGSV
ncbi:hypothetical protein ABZV14_38900, partial [Streptosporangium canum]|uniref:hypothetical protein n=1 Tax=Streptosporangium canum TaxID=324952 RepID=UPI00339F51D7